MNRMTTSTIIKWQAKRVGEGCGATVKVRGERDPHKKHETDNLMSELMTAMSEIETDNVETDQVTTDNVETGQVTTDNVETGQVTTDNVETDQVTTDNVETDQVTTDKVETDQVTTDNVETAR
jgi:hypothetical protein